MATGTEAQIATFIAKFTPEMARTIKASRKRMRTIVPRGVEMVYDNYNFLVFGFGPSDRASEAVLSLACAPQWVTLCFLWGVRLKDPKKLLKGAGNQVRHVRLMGGPGDLDDPDIRELIDQALAGSGKAFAAAGKLETVVKAVSAKQRARRPKG